MKKFLTTLIHASIIGIAGIGPGFWAGYFAYKAQQQQQPPMTVEPSHDLLLLSETPEGTRVYRVNGPKSVVPITVVVSKTGSVAVR
jgi:hypothetical protein